MQPSKVMALLSVCGLAVDEARGTHLEPLVASLIADGERLTAQIDREAEPHFIAPSAGSTGQGRHAGA